MASGDAACRGCGFEFIGQLVVTQKPEAHGHVVEARRRIPWDELDKQVRVRDAAAHLGYQLLLTSLGFQLRFTPESHLHQKALAAAASTPEFQLAKLLEPLEKSVSHNELTEFLYEQVRVLRPMSCHARMGASSGRLSKIREQLGSAWPEVRRAHHEDLLLEAAAGRGSSERLKLAAWNPLVFSGVALSCVALEALEKCAARFRSLPSDDGAYALLLVGAAGLARQQILELVSPAVAQWRDPFPLFEVAHFAGVLDVAFLEAALARGTLDRDTLLEFVASLGQRRRRFACPGFADVIRGLLTAFGTSSGKAAKAYRAQQAALAADPPPWNLEPRPAWYLEVGGGRVSRPPSEAKTRCACGKRRPLLVQLRLSEVDASFPDRLVRVFWCGTCWERGEPSEDNVEVVSRAAAGAASCLGDGRRLSFTRFEDYPSESAAQRLVPAKRYSSVSYRRFLQEKLASTRRTTESKVGGYPSSPQGSDEIDQVVDNGYAFECDACGEPMRTVIQLVDDANLKVGADTGTLHVHLCTSRGCKLPSAEVEFATY